MMPELTLLQVGEVCGRYANATAPAELGSGRPTVVPIPDVTEAAAANDLVLPSGLLLRIQAALQHGNVRLIGPPGTGKSTLARAVLESAVGEEGYVFTVATGQWTGEDVIGGPAPDPNNPGLLTFHAGLILDAADKGKWVGIDEMNRADIDAAFGEFFGLLAGFDLELPYPSGAGDGSRVRIYATRPEGDLDRGRFGLPPGWRMLATMNSWDKLSLNRVSFAFSRRWCTVFLPVPDPPQFAEILANLFSHYLPEAPTSVHEAIGRLFVDEGSDEAPSLRSLGYGMGPGIAKSMVRDIAAMASLSIPYGEAFAQSVDGYLLPQFEGALESHEALVQCLSATLGAAGAGSSAIDQLDGKLTVFTGQRTTTHF